MDCEKYEPLLLDELYDELDELTSAAVKRHVSGCARCAGILQGMKGTRRSVDLPIVLPSPDLEERILAAAREAQKVVPFRARASRVLSRAGSWAMRPQTAMAAVFLLMIGSSAFLVRSRSEMAPQSVSVTVAGEPSPAAAPADHDRLSDPATAAAHGAAVAQNVAPAATPSPMTDDALGEARGKAAPKADLAATAGGGAPAAEAEKKMAFAESDPWAPNAQGLTAQATPAAKPAATAAPTGASEAFAAGMASYRARSFADATQKFDAAAETGDVNAALWAAKSARDGSGCAVALGRFDAVARRAAGTWHGNEAELEAARCEIAVGQLDGARARLQKLRGVSTHAAAAQKELAELDAIAARKSMDKSGAGSGGSAAARAAPARPAMAPAPAKAADTASGY